MTPERICVFEGGPLDGATEVLVAPPDQLEFSSARLEAWDDGPLRVADVLYRLEDAGGPAARYRFAP